MSDESDEEHRFKSKVDAAASMTYPQPADKIGRKGYIVINNRPCKVIYLVESISRSKFSPTYGKIGLIQFTGCDIFTAKVHVVIVPPDTICEVPRVNCTDYQLIDISEDGFVSLCTKNGGTKDDVRLPTDDSLRTLINDGFADGKKLVVSVMSAMGEEQIYAVKEIEIGSELCGRKRSRCECDVSATGEKQICLMEIGPK